MIEKGDDCMITKEGSRFDIHKSGNLYFLPTIEDFTDDYSGTIFVSSLVYATEKFLADIALHEEVKCIHSDNGTKFTNRANILTSCLKYNIFQ